MSTSQTAVKASELQAPCMPSSFPKSSAFRFIVRDFVYDEQSLKAGKNERDKLQQEKAKQYAPLVRWLRINFGEIFSAYVHVKALRVFVESVLRWVVFVKW